MSLDPNLVQAANSQLVPASFAEKAMASLMQLHEDLCAEKEKRVELYRQLMEKEQALAELAMYVRLLEERLDGEKGAAAPASSAQASSPGVAQTASASSVAASATSMAAPVAGGVHAASVGSASSASAPASAVALAPELPTSTLAGELASHVAPRPPEIAAGPARKAPARLKPDDWKVW